MAQDHFVEYYEKQSAAERTGEHFLRLRDMLVRVHGGGGPALSLRVADIGCGADTCSRIWADVGCQVEGIDVNPALIAIGRERPANE